MATIQAFLAQGSTAGISIRNTYYRTNLNHDCLWKIYTEKSTKDNLFQS